MEWNRDCSMHMYLTYWGRVTHKWVGKLTITRSDNGLSPGRRQAIIWTNAEILLTGLLGTKISEILIEIDTCSLKKMRLKVLSGKWRPFCLGLNVLTQCCDAIWCSGSWSILLELMTSCHLTPKPNPNQCWHYDLSKTLRYSHILIQGNTLKNVIKNCHFLKCNFVQVFVGYHAGDDKMSSWCSK